MAHQTVLNAAVADFAQRLQQHIDPLRVRRLVIPARESVTAPAAGDLKGDLMDQNLSSFVLRFPFRPQSAITGIDESTEFAVGSLTARLRSRDRHVILDVRGFSSAEAASAFIPVVWAALRWVLIERGLNTTAELVPQTVTWAADPEAAGRNLSKSFGMPYTGPVHGIGDEGTPVIYEDGKQVRFLGVGEATATVTTPVALFLVPFRDALGWPSAAALVADSRFRLASDIYSAFHFEGSAASRLVSLGMTLEVLAEPVTKHPEALRLLDRWRTEVAQQRMDLAGDEDALHALESLERELLVRREASVRSRIRNTAIDLGASLGPEESKRLAREAVATYDARSTLVHDGALPEPRLSQAVERGREVVRVLLHAYFRRASAVVAPGTVGP